VNNNPTVRDFVNFAFRVKMKPVEIKVFDDEQKETFAKFLTISPFQNPLQSWEWGEVKTSKTWKVQRLGFYEVGKLLAIAQVLERKLIFGFTLFYIPYGPLCNWKNRTLTLEILKSLTDYLRPKSKALFLKIEPPAENSATAAEIFSRLGFTKVKKSIQPQQTAIINLAPKSETIFDNFEKDTRYSIRRAQREEVSVKHFTNPLNLQPVKEFYNLYETTAKRGKFPPRPFSQFEKIWRTMAPQNKVMISQAWFKEIILAAALILKSGKKAFLLYAGSVRDEAFKNKFPTYLLQWEIIRELKKQGFQSYDLWGVAPDSNPKHPWAGHTLFKRGFRGRETEYLGSFDLPLSPWYKIYTFLSNSRYFLAGLKNSKIKSDAKK